MARPERHDVDYFPFFVKRGKTLNILQNKYGLEGIGFFTNLMRFLSLTPDHFYCIKEEDDRLNFFAEIGIQEEEKGIGMIELMIKTGKLDKELWEKHKVIACEAFLNSLEEAYKQRKNEIITIDEIRAIFEKSEKDDVSIHGNPVNIHDNPHTAGLSSEISSHNPQSKEKKSKEKKSKEDIPSQKPIALLNREPKNDLERVNKKWLENYIAIFGEQPINPRWDISSSRIAKILKQTSVEKVLAALDAAKTDKFCLESGYILQSMMSGSVISKLINKPPSAGPPPGLNDKKALGGLTSWK